MNGITVLPEVRLMILRHDVCDYSAVHVRKVVESHFLWIVNMIKVRAVAGTLNI